MSNAVTSRIHWLAPMGQPRLLALAAAALCASAGVSAQVQVQAQAKESTMEEVVVSASGFEQELKDAPASISVVTRKELETKNFRDLAEGFCRSKGLRLKSACVARLFKRPVSRTGWQRTRLCLVGSTALF